LGQQSALCDLIGFEPRHFQNGAEGIEAVALGDLGEFAGERYIAPLYSVRQIQEFPHRPDRWCRPRAA
jgi:hypothetical protein